MPTVSWRQPVDRIDKAEQLAAAVGPPLDLDLALGEPFRPDQDLPGNADQVGGGEFCSWTLVEIIIEHLDPFGGELAIEPLGGGIGVGGALLEVEDRDLEGRYRLRPFDAGIVVRMPR